VELRKRKVYAKVSGLPRPTDAQSQSPSEPASYKPMLDFIWDIFGEDFIVFAAGWSRMPTQPTPVERMKSNLKIFHAYLQPKGRPAAEKFFWQNSVRAFKWVRRDPKQPQLT
jgi:predicted TIM-barrel fold metal-dependent hydrolase